ncbi:hypothetical protein DFQ26_006632 [Actinomortierella ambigua]|nr:hypothetical protein DFQ26_006632 [Actinomortierella ambigua]
METTPTRRPPAPPAATKTNAPRPQRTTNTPNRRPPRTTTTAVVIRATTSTTTTTTASPTPTEAPSGGGMSGGAIGGIIAGVLVAFAAVFGLLFYKRRKRRAVADTKRNMVDDSPPSYQPPSDGPGISGPMSLAPESGVSSNEKQRLPEALYNENKHFQPGMRDELLAMPPRGQNNPPNQNNRGPGRPGQGYYEDGLVQDYYGGSPIGAQQPVRQPSMKSLHQGNQTPLPGQIHRQNGPGGQGPPGMGRRDSSASTATDDSGGFLTYEEAQKAHNRKIMGHKESISSETDLEKYRTQPPQYHDHQQQQQQQQQQQPPRPPPPGMEGKGQHGDLLSPTSARFDPGPEHNSVVMSESTVSMMPALPPTASPMPTTRPGVAPNGNPYAESAFSDEYDDRSLYSAYYGGEQGYGGSQYGGQSPQHYNQPPSPAYSNYNSHNAYPPRGGPPPNHYPQHSPPHGGGGGYRPGPPSPHGGGGYQSSPMMRPYPGGGNGGGGGGGRPPAGPPPAGPPPRPAPPQQRSNAPTGLGPLMQHDPHNPFPPRGAPRQQWC